jgi:aspartyl-tRNA(Asn)/glutamyl-tRNA(Gln) amidotransferase subunit A
MRPTWGLVSRYGLMKGIWSMDTVGPISRSVADAAITLGAIAGHDPKDAYSWNRPVPDYLAALDGDISGIRIGVVTELLHDEVVEPETRDMVQRAIAVLGELGASVGEVSIPLTAHANTISSILLAAEPAQNQREWVQNRLEDYGHDNRIGLLTGSLMPGAAYLKAQKLRSMLRQEVHDTLEQYDVLVCPTAGRPAVPRQDDPIITSKEMAGRLPYMRTNTFNLSSTPAVSVPCGFNSGTLPIGLQVAGKPGGDAMVLKVAHAYEQATSWHTMRPPHA